MDILFKCPNCEQEMEVDSSGAGSEVECPNCQNAITVPMPETGAAEPEPAAPPAKPVRHFVVPVHAHAPPDGLIQKPTVKTLDVIAKEGDKTMRIKTFKRGDCQDVGKDHFDQTVSEFLEKVGQANIVSVHPIAYSYEGTRHVLTDYGVLIVFKG
jgi:DNA-directed RNA polymerase subunit RPC12/RpoP